MRADKAALVALEAGVRVPDRNLCGDAALLVSGETHIHDAVDIIGKCAHGQVIALLQVDRIEDLRNDFRYISDGCGLVRSICPAAGYDDLIKAFTSCVNRGEVSCDNFFAFGEIRFGLCFLHIADRFFDRYDRHQMEKCGLEDHIEMVAKPELPGNGHRIDRVKTDFIGKKAAPDPGRQLLLKLLLRP